jgi:hypothetical protein
MGTGPLSQGVKQQGREADHSPPFSAEIKNGGAILALPHMSSWHYAYGQLYLFTGLYSRYDVQ